LKYNNDTQVVDRLEIIHADNIVECMHAYFIKTLRFLEILKVSIALYSAIVNKKKMIKNYKK
jgi:hypothetical protein